MKKHDKLNAWRATAICGNDITSSCLYVSALTIGMAGQYAWISLLMVSGVLFLYRKIYGEVVGALPLNGGAYNVLLNTTSKSNASIAACLTILSYMATAVISASEAMHYLDHSIRVLNINYATIALLFVFLCLTILGISESARVALVIFIVHLGSMALLILSAVYFLLSKGSEVFVANYAMPIKGGGVMHALFFGFAIAMLGISGFESSANFVEEQKQGVFPKTLRNMWIAITILNPFIAFLAIATVPIAEINQNNNSLLSYMAELTGGHWFALLVSLNAVTVLSGAVLTSFIGVNGLIKRMTLDRILPQFLLRENKKGSNYLIPISFFLLCVSVLFVTRGELAPLAGVYTISFLSVMAFFAIGNLILKIKRARLQRPEYASPTIVVVAFLAIVAALYGNIKLKPVYLVVFLQYFVSTMIVIYAMLNRLRILEFFLSILQNLTNDLRKITLLSRLRINKFIVRLNNQEFVFFSKANDIAILNKVLMYVEENEITRRLKIVTILNEHQTVPESFVRDFEVLQRAYPDMNTEFITIVGVFGPDIIKELSIKWNIAKNFMFIGSPGEKFPYRLEELGGVRLVI